jgi:hypothetical protein
MELESYYEELLEPQLPEITMDSQLICVRCTCRCFLKKNTDFFINKKPFQPFITKVDIMECLTKFNPTCNHKKLKKILKKNDVLVHAIFN